MRVGAAAFSKVGLLTFWDLALYAGGMHAYNSRDGGARWRLARRISACLVGTLKI